MLLKDTGFVIFDFETTGLYPYSGDRICEIGAVKIVPDRRGQIKFHTMVNPQRPISRGAFMVNGITEEMLKGAPSINKVIAGFMNFIDGYVLVAYNEGFDLGFLESALGENSRVLEDYTVIDVLTLARRLFPGIGRYNLANVARSLGVHSGKEHRAMSDVSMTLKIFEKELDILRSSGIDSVEDISAVKARRLKCAETVRDPKSKLIERAVREKKKLEITYHSMWSNKTNRRVISPIEVRSGYDKRYVIAYCHSKCANRNFLLDGILEAKVQD